MEVIDKPHTKFHAIKYLTTKMYVNKYTSTSPTHTYMHIPFASCLPMKIGGIYKGKYHVQCVMLLSGKQARPRLWQSCQQFQSLLFYFIESDTFCCAYNAHIFYLRKSSS